MPYERLITHNRQELNRITGALDVGMNGEMLALLNEPSSSVKGSVRSDPKAQLRKWKDQMSTEDIDGVLRVVDECGLSAIYDDAVEPNYDRLNALQDGRYQW